MNYQSSAQTKACLPRRPAPAEFRMALRAVALSAMLASMAPMPAWGQVYPPIIGDSVPAQRLDGEVEATLWASGVTHPENIEIDKVIARIAPPLLADGADAASPIFYEIGLDDMGGGLWTFAYADFFDPGTYEISLHAIDANGLDSAPAFTQVIQEAEELIPDPFEPDNTPAEATWIGVNSSRLTHNFHEEGDED